jgi:hypothetical protein
LKDRSEVISSAGRSRRWQKIISDRDPDSYFYIEVLDCGAREQVGLFDGIDFEQINDLLGDIANRFGSTLRRAGPSKATIELGVQFGYENGKLIALIGGASIKATLKIGIEWEPLGPHTPSD